MKFRIINSGTFLTFAFFISTIQLAVLAKDCHSKKLKLKLVAKNMNAGFDFSNSVLPIPGTAVSQFWTQGVSLPVTATLDQYAQVFENIWRQVNDPSYQWASARLDQMAEELAVQHADIISLQECALYANNPVINPDGTRRFGFAEIETINGVYGDENSPDDIKVLDYCKMIVDRLKYDHDQEFVVVSRILTDYAQGPRSEAGFNAATVDFSAVVSSNVLLVRKSLHAKVVRDTSKISQYARIANCCRFLDFSNPPHEILARPLFGFSRGYNIVDLDIKGTIVRMINVHLSSGDLRAAGTNTWNPPLTTAANNPVSAEFQQAQDFTGASRSAMALELREQEIIPSPYPVIVSGDFNTGSTTEQTDQNRFPAGAYQTLVDSGVMTDAAVQVHGQAGAVAFKNGGLQTGTGLPLWVVLRDPNQVYKFRTSFVMYRNGDGVKALNFKATQPFPFEQTPEHPFAWTSDHNGMATVLSFPTKIKKHCCK